MRSRRRGYSLIESLVVIVLTGTTLTVVTLMMHTLHRTEHRWREDLRTQRALEQLAFRLRQDAHGATSVTIGQSRGDRSKSLTLATADEQTIVYSSSPAAIERVVQRGERVAHRDRFLLAAAVDSFWTIDTRFERPVIVFHWPQPVPNQSVPDAAPFAQTVRAVVNVTPVQPLAK